MSLLRCIGRIQDVGGWIVVVNNASKEVVSRSRNVGKVSKFYDLRKHGTTRVMRVEHLPMVISSSWRVFTVFFRAVSGREDLTLVEGCPLHHTSSSPHDCAIIRDIVDDMCSFNDEASLFRGACEGLKRIIRYDRAMAYQFDSQWNGQVIFERIIGSDPVSYLGLHFPETDIPQAARDMYLEQRVRFIFDVDSAEVSFDTRGTPIKLDLSECVQRGVSDVHVRYMKNMGIRGSVSIAIIMRGALWGLLVLHSKNGYKVIDSVSMDACKIICSIISMKMDEFRSKRRDEVMRSTEKECAACETVTDLLKVASCKLQLHTAFTLMRGEMKVLLDCDDADMVISRVMSADFEEDIVVAPYRVLRIGMGDGDCAYLIRKSVMEEVSWSGDPSKPYIEVDGEVHPRNSFRTFVLKRMLEPLEWSSTERDIVDLLRLHMQSCKRKELVMQSTSGGAIVSSPAPHEV
ncbi:GAF domain-like protein [Tribonema minus]|uniref:GAF domain-like protein n=1 Tax=Tribonema minus TaxID=303371 RepID=A0A835Z4F3_9STRA|nr:GAF domain-like protein [Tribonema minus]